MNKSRTLPVVLSIGLLLVFVGCFGSKSKLKVGSSDEGEVVEAVGLAPNNAGDLIAVKRASLLDAQRKAIEKSVGVFVSAKTMVEKAVAIEDNILAKTDGYIKKYDVLKEWEENGLYHTKIRALVALKDLEDDLNDLSLLNTPELERPRIYINIKEQVGKDYIDDLPASRTLESRLMDQGFVVVTEEEKDEAEINIEGKASAFPFQTEGLGGFISYRARITLQARLPGTKKIIESYSKEASGLGGNDQLAGLKALETVGQLTGDELGPKLAETWTKDKSLVIMIEGVKKFEDVDRIRKHLVSQPGVKDLVLRRYDEDLAQFEVQLDSVNSTELASRLEASKSVKLKVVETTPQSLHLKY